MPQGHASSGAPSSWDPSLSWQLHLPLHRLTPQALTCASAPPSWTLWFTSCDTCHRVCPGPSPAAGQLSSRAWILGGEGQLVLGSLWDTCGEGPTRRQVTDAIPPGRKLASQINESLSYLVRTELQKSSPEGDGVAGAVLPRAVPGARQALPQTAQGPAVSLLEPLSVQASFQVVILDGSQAGREWVSPLCPCPWLCVALLSWTRRTP